MKSLMMSNFKDFFSNDPWLHVSDDQYPLGNRLYLNDDRFWVSRNEKKQLLFFIHEKGTFNIDSLENIAGVDIEICQHDVSSSRLICTLISEEEETKNKFSLIAKDIAYHCSNYKGIQLFSEIKRRLISWSNFLKPTRSGLSNSEFVGLLGEMFVVSEVLAKNLNQEEVVRFWVGPEGKKQDIILNRIAIEIKTSLSGAPHTLKISSIDQLDKVTDKLYILHLVGSPSNHPNGFSLRSMYLKLLNYLEQELNAKMQFLQKTSELYGKATKTQLDEKYTILSMDLYEVSDQFPAITNAKIPLGVVKVNYELSIESIRDFKITQDVQEIIKNG